MEAKAITTEGLNPNQFLDFTTAKVQNITMDQLRRTYKENDAYGTPISGMYHFDFFDKVTDICNELGYEPEYYDLFAAQNRDGRTPGVTLCPQFEEKYGDHAVEAHTLRRVFANIRIKDFDTEDYTTNLSIAFHQKGIQAGFGNNVKICHNQCMLNADMYGATYSERGTAKYDIPQMLDLIKSWLCDARNIIETDRERIERMKSITVNADNIIKLIGQLTVARVARDTKNKTIHTNVHYPLNQAQICLYTEDLLVRQHEQNKITVWDLYDAATNLYKVTSLDMPMVLPANRLMVEFLQNEGGFSF